MTKKLITIKEFINKSIGEWKALRSTHTLAFQEYENTNSRILISYIKIDSFEVDNLLKKFDLNFKAEFAISINWRAESDWSDEEKINSDKNILIFSPGSSKDGLILRNKGYAEQINSYSTYKIDDNESLNLTTAYDNTTCEEKVSFLTDNVRTRYSIIKSKSNGSIIQTSHSTEIRKIFN